MAERTTNKSRLTWIYKLSRLRKTKEDGCFGVGFGRVICGAESVMVEHIGEGGDGLEGSLSVVSAWRVNDSFSSSM